VIQFAQEKLNQLSHNGHPDCGTKESEGEINNGANIREEMFGKGGVTVILAKTSDDSKHTVLTVYQSLKSALFSFRILTYRFSKRYYCCTGHTKVDKPAVHWRAATP